jgi:hypothetical protein
MCVYVERGCLENSIGQNTIDSIGQDGKKKKKKRNKPGRVSARVKSFIMKILTLRKKEKERKADIVKLQTPWGSHQM